jgi:HSP20 family protein
MTLVRYEPLWGRHPFNQIQRRMNRLFEDFLQPEEEEGQIVNWAPRVDVTEHDDRYEVVVELPGLGKEEVKLELHNNILTISGEKKSESEKKERNLFVCERLFGSFRRSFQFPTQINQEKIDADFQNGVLTIKLPKVEEAKPKSIEIKVN